MSAKKTRDATGRYAYDGLERVMHEKARLGILTSLAAKAEGLVFTDLKELCQLTDGNLFVLNDFGEPSQPLVDLVTFFESVRDAAEPFE